MTPFTSFGVVYSITNQVNGLFTLKVRAGKVYEPTTYAEHTNLTKTKLEERVGQYQAASFAHYIGKQ